MMQTVSPAEIVSPTFTKAGLSGEGFLYKVPMIGDLISMYFCFFGTGSDGDLHVTGLQFHLARA